MTLWIQKKYLNIISPRLERFVWKKENEANFRCPFCGDSKTNKAKARGYVFEKSPNLIFKCHNCNHSTNLAGLLKHLDMSVYQQYSLDVFGKKAEQAPVVTATPVIKKIRPTVLPIDLSASIGSLPSNHPARVYIANRKIPSKHFDILYYAPDFKALVDKLIPDHGKEWIPSDQRIVIPFYDEKGRIITIQGRALDPQSKIRYMTLKTDESAAKIYGLERWDKSRHGYITEGPFDSLFIDNCIATAGSNLSDLKKYIFSSDFTIIYDNEPRNSAIVHGITNSIENGFSVFIWPKTMKHIKDINDAILAGIGIEEIRMIIDKHTYTGLAAKLEVANWSKV